MDCHVQIFLDGRWKTAAVFEPDTQKIDKGIAGGGRLQYDTDKRNQQVLRTNYQVGLSPLFDFAPMFLDPEGIGRVSRWEDERPGNQPEWTVICEKFKNLMAPIETRTWLADLGESVKRLPEIMLECHVDDEIIQRLTGWIGEVATGLVKTRPRTRT